MFGLVMPSLARPAAWTASVPSELHGATVLHTWCRSFDTKAGEWHDVHLPFEEFIPLFRAKTVKDGAKLDPSTVTSIQVHLHPYRYIQTGTVT